MTAESKKSDSKEFNQVEFFRKFRCVIMNAVPFAGSFSRPVPSAGTFS
jgi:hypothetical protein